MPSLPCVVAFSLVDLKTFGPLALRSSPFYLVHPPLSPVDGLQSADASPGCARVEIQGRKPDRPEAVFGHSCSGNDNRSERASRCRGIAAPQSGHSLGILWTSLCITTRPPTIAPVLSRSETADRGPTIIPR